MLPSIPHSAAEEPSTGGKRNRVFIVDDHAVFRHGLAQLIGSEADLEVCGQAPNASEALGRLRTVRADAVVLDVSLPGANGLELVKNLRAEHPALPLLVLSMHDESQYGLRSLRAGANGYLMKSEAADRVVPALRKVLEGDIFVSPSMSERLIYRVARGAEEGTKSPVDALSDRELEILHLVGNGKSSRDIAETLRLSVKTVESHRLHIKEKLGCRNSTEMVRFAMDWVEHQAA